MVIESVPTEPVVEKVVRGVEVEALLDLGVRGEEDVCRGDGQDQEVRADIPQPPPRPHGWWARIQCVENSERFGTLVHFLPAPEIWSAGETDDGGP